MFHQKIFSAKILIFYLYREFQIQKQFPRKHCFLEERRMVLVKQIKGEGEKGKISC